MKQTVAYATLPTCLCKNERERKWRRKIKRITRKKEKKITEASSASVPSRSWKAYFHWGGYPARDNTQTVGTLGKSLVLKNMGIASAWCNARQRPLNSRRREGGNGTSGCFGTWGLSVRPLVCARAFFLRCNSIAAVCLFFLFIFNTLVLWLFFFYYYYLYRHLESYLTHLCVFCPFSLKWSALERRVADLATENNYFGGGYDISVWID